MDSGVSLVLHKRQTQDERVSGLNVNVKKLMLLIKVELPKKN